MVGIAEIGGAISGLKAALDIAKGLNAAADAVAINEAKIALQVAILDAQSALLQAQESQSGAAKRISELEGLVAKFENWEHEKSRYSLQEFSTGALVYVLKQELANDEPSHRICPACYQEGAKSILQTVRKRGGGETVECPRCETGFKLSEFPTPQVDHGPSYF